MIKCTYKCIEINVKLSCYNKNCTLFSVPFPFIRDAYFVNTAGKELMLISNSKCNV